MKYNVELDKKQLELVKDVVNDHIRNLAFPAELHDDNKLKERYINEMRDFEEVEKQLDSAKVASK